MFEEFDAVFYIFLSCAAGLSYGIYNIIHVSKINLEDDPEGDKDFYSQPIDADTIEDMKVKAKYIADGAHAFLMQEYYVLLWFMIIFSIVIFFLVEEELGNCWTVFSFILGCITSIISGFIGMKMAVLTNVRVTRKAVNDIGTAFDVAFRGGAVMGFCLVSLGLLMLTILIMAYKKLYLPDLPNVSHFQAMFECIAGYGLGGSSIALFGRVGGGIYTKAADVGADLVGKIEENLEEDSPMNPGVIADNVGDNVGDIAGMGSDLFGSFAESSCAALVVSGTSEALTYNVGHLYFPLLISASGIFVGIITAFFATHIMKVDIEDKVEKVLKYQLWISTILATILILVVAFWSLPEEFHFRPHDPLRATPMKAFNCVACGLWSGLIIGLTTEYYTSNQYHPVQQLAESCNVGPATDIIYGLALGYSSCIIPILCLSITIYISFENAHMYGVALAALGMLSTLTTALTIDAYGPISDNAGGIAEMCDLKQARSRTDALDAAGNTTAAIGKGFAIGSACLVALALFGAFITRTGLPVVDILRPLEFSGLIIGAMLPYAFSALTMKSVGDAALEMVTEIQTQFRNDPGIKRKESTPNYAKCIAISTKASLREMIAPGVLVMCTPILVGFLFGPKGVAGVLAGSIVSGVQMAISFANSGGAWDNAKKFIESGRLIIDDKVRGKHSDEHHASIIGDTVGDPLKDTSGPAINILVKLMAIISLVFGGFFVKTGYLSKIATD